MLVGLFQIDFRTVLASAVAPELTSCGLSSILTPYQKIH